MGEIETEDLQPEDAPAVEAAEDAPGYDTVALRELRRARRLIRDAEGGSIPAEASIAVGAAQVLALLDLAAAIRGQSS